MANPESPNIILVNCDDLGYGDLGCYGSQKNQTPVLDSLADEGMRWTQFYMAAPVCSPSRGALLTGCYPPRIGFAEFEGLEVLFPGQDIGLNPEENTFASLLQERGYATKCVGKWHCGDQEAFLPHRHGFDEYFGLPYSNDMGLQRHIGPCPPLPLLQNEKVVEQQPDQSELTARYVEESLNFIQANQHQPFFLYLAHLYVHLPLYVPDSFLEKSENGPYGAAVSCIDWAMGQILETLSRLDLEENTLVIFTSDNGSRAREEGGSNGVLRGAKGTTWEGGQRVPCIMRWPGKIPAGSTCDALASAMDFYPTLAGIGGATIPDDRKLDGKDLKPLLEAGGEGPSPHQYFFYYWKHQLEAVRNHHWKLHTWKQGKAHRALYHLEQDPGETTDLAAQNPDVVAELEVALESCRQDLGDSLAGTSGENTRPAGRVQNPQPLTQYDPDHPYVVALYDCPYRNRMPKKS